MPWHISCLLYNARDMSDFVASRTNRVLLTGLSIILIHLVLPGGPLPALAFVALTPLALALSAAPPRESLVHGFACGFLGWLGATPGLAEALSAYTRLSLPAATMVLVLLCSYLALPYAVFGWIQGSLRSKKLGLGSLGAAALLAAMVSLFPSPIPIDIVHSLYVFPTLIQILEVGGDSLLRFIMVLISWLAADALLRIGDARRAVPVLVQLMVVIVVVAGYGHYRLAELQRVEQTAGTSRTLTVAAIQPNIPLPRVKRGGAETSAEIMRDMSRQTLARSPGIDLVVWPEIPYRIPCDTEAGNVARIAADISTRLTFLVNCTESAPGGGDYNTALLVSATGSKASYQKRHLFPFAEYLPGEARFPIIRSLLPAAGRYHPGAEVKVFEIREGLHVFAAICYEVIFLDDIRSLVARGGNVLVNQTNDEWFGESRISNFLVASSVFAAVAYRVPLIRVSNSANTMFVKPTGEPKKDFTPPRAIKATAVTQIFAFGEPSLYARGGYLVPYALLISWFVACFWKSIRLRRTA